MVVLVDEWTQTLSTTSSEKDVDQPQYEQPPNHYAVPYAHEEDMWRGSHRDDSDDNPEITALASSRHNSHYFSNQDLFGLSSSQHFRYSKYSELVTEPTRRTPSLRVHNLSFALDSRTFLDRACLRLANKSSVLQDVSFELFSGDMVAVLYTSEYEKSCLLHLITGTQNESGKIRGEFLINGHKQRESQLRKRITFVREETDLSEDLTVLQYLKLYTEFHPPPRGRIQKIESVLSSLACFPLRNRACSTLGRAEKVRVNLAAHILRNTDILVCDTILKDMDVYDLAFTIDFLRDWALKSGRIVVIAVQPSSLEMLEMFSKVLFIASGQVAYFGSTEDMVPYFESIHFPCPMFRNPCDYYVDVATHDHLSDEASRNSLQRISSICSQWSHKRKNPEPPLISQQAPLATECSVFKAMLLVYRSFWLKTLRKPLRVLREALLILAASSFVCITFSSMPEERRTSADDRLGLVAIVIFFALVPLQCYWLLNDANYKKKLAIGKRDGFFGSLVFMTSLIVFNFPWTVFCSMLLYVPVFLLTDFYPTEVDIFQLLSFLLPLTAYLLLTRQLCTFWAFILSSRTASLLLLYVSTIFLFLLSGIPFPLENYPILAVLSPPFWASELLLQQQFLRTSLISTLLDQPQTPSDLLIGCERRQVLAHTIGDVPIFGVARCSKYKGSQLLYFFGYQSSPLSFTSTMLAGTVTLFSITVLCILSCLAATTVRFRKRQVYSKYTR